MMKKGDGKMEEKKVNDALQLDKEELEAMELLHKRGIIR